MRLSYALLAAAGQLAGAVDWMGQELEGRGGHLIHARQTRASEPDGANGWTPKPTEAPFVGDGLDALELARRGEEWIRRKRQTENTWLNERTCGWRAGISSSAFVCPSSATCATNRDNVVACNEEGSSTNFFTMCFDYQASVAGACESMGPKTGCCMTSSIGACVTYLWPGTAPRSMFRCHTEQSIVTMLSEPQFVIDDRTRTTSTTSSSSSSTASESVTSPIAPGQTTDGAPPPTAGESSSSNIGAIVGGVVGGVAGIALIAGLIFFFLIRERNKNANGASPQAYSAVAPGDTSYPGAGGMGQPTGYPPTASPSVSQPGYFTPSSMAATLQPDGLNGPPPPVPGMYDPRQSYYEPHKVGEYQQQHGMPHPTGYAAYPGATPPQGAPYPAPHQPVSELDNTNIAAGQHGNPVEMAVNSPVQR
ncbi:hypothetical protein MFIFM68171_04885 [Madurella fahalii]|uniref:Uncharacterized protein n=1 Tax=Madurella fahalii TaxID=1157608 RepID=A0ABQ0GA80_9PEZI